MLNNAAGISSGMTTGTTGSSTAPTANTKLDNWGNFINNLSQGAANILNSFTGNAPANVNVQQGAPATPQAADNSWMIWLFGGLLAALVVFLLFSNRNSGGTK